MKSNTRSNLKLISADVKPSGKKTPKKSYLFHNKTQLENSPYKELLNVPHHERSYHQYLEIKSKRESERALYRHHCCEQLNELKPKRKEVVSYLFMLHMKHRIVNPTQGTMWFIILLRFSERSLKEVSEFHLLTKLANFCKF